MLALVLRNLPELSHLLDPKADKENTIVIFNGQIKKRGSKETKEKIIVICLESQSK